MTNGKKYIIVFLLTCGIFAVSVFFSTYANRQKIQELQAIQNKVSVDLLSSETQFALLEEMSCTDVDNSILSQEIANLADKRAITEENLSKAKINRVNITRGTIPHHQKLSNQLA